MDYPDNAYGSYFIVTAAASADTGMDYPDNAYGSYLSLLPPRAPKLVPETLSPTLKSAWWNTLAFSWRTKTVKPTHNDDRTHCLSSSSPLSMYEVCYDVIVTSMLFRPSWGLSPSYAQPSQLLIVDVVSAKGQQANNTLTKTGIISSVTAHSHSCHYKDMPFQPGKQHAHITRIVSSVKVRRHKLPRYTCTISIATPDPYIPWFPTHTRLLMATTAPHVTYPPRITYRIYVLL